MKIIVLGAGLLGVSTAYELGKRGFEVTVLDRRGGAGAETSFSNGGQLSYSAAEPWASPHVLAKLPLWLFNPDAPLVFHPRLDPDMISWGLRFLRNCTSTRAYVNCLNLLRLGLYSRKRMAKIRTETGIEFDFTQKGILHIYGSAKDLENGIRQRDLQAKFGCEQNVLTREECITLEPCLAHTSRVIAGGIHSVMDEIGDAYKYCTSLAKIAAERHNVKFIYETDIQKLMAENGRIAGVKTSKGEMTADGFVMALSAYSVPLLKKIGIKIPIYPMKGYSLTLDADEYTPVSSIMDCNYKVVYTRLGNRLRISGTAELAGYNDRIAKKRIDTILRAAQSILPKSDWSQPMHEWACLRPSTPDGLPRLGFTPYPNLFLNTGHGTLGWTQAAGSASIVADIMENKQPEILLDGMILERQ